MEIQKLSLAQLNRPQLEEYLAAPKRNYLVVADHIRSGLNVGSLFRTADAFACRKVCLVGLTPVPPNKEILKSALGATTSVEWAHYETISPLVHELKSNGIKIVVVEQTTGSVPLQQFVPDPDETYALVLGNEVDGVSEEFIRHADVCLEIPQAGTKHSLNVSVCAGIVMWHLFEKTGSG